MEDKHRDARLLRDVLSTERVRMRIEREKILGGGSEPLAHLRADDPGLDMTRYKDSAPAKSPSGGRNA